MVNIIIWENYGKSRTFYEFFGHKERKTMEDLVDWRKMEMKEKSIVYDCHPT